MVAWCVVALASPSSAKSFTWTPDSARHHQVELWLDPYYTALNATHTFSEEPIAKLVSDGERATDWWLFRHLLDPRDALVEGSVNPLPVGGWAVRRFASQTYREARVGDVNLVKAVTEGFPEPWAVSLFFGNVVNLVRGTDTATANGTAYSGFLISGSRWNLLDNRLVEGDWLEGEIKVKGEDLRPERRMGWSFRAGWREHFNRDIRSYLYGSIRRTRTDFRYQGWHPLRNSSLELRMDLDRESLPRIELDKWSLVLGKKFPFHHQTMAWSLYLGVLQEIHSGYEPALEPPAPKGWRLILQPDLEW